MKTETPTQLSRTFLARSVHHLQDDFLPRIRRCLEKLNEDEIWWRSHDNMNSVGNLVLHLTGNVRQWIVSGIGGEPDSRQRDQEFSEKGPIPKAELLSRLESAVTDAVEVLESVSPRILLEKRTIQTYEVSGLEAILHVVEHFSHHTGQIILITRLVKNADLKFYPF